MHTLCNMSSHNSFSLFPHKKKQAELPVLQPFCLFLINKNCSFLSSTEVQINPQQLKPLNTIIFLLSLLIKIILLVMPISIVLVKQSNKSTPEKYHS